MVNPPSGLGAQSPDPDDESLDSLLLDSPTPSLLGAGGGGGGTPAKHSNHDLAFDIEDELDDGSVGTVDTPPHQTTQPPSNPTPIPSREPSSATTAGATTGAAAIPDAGDGRIGVVWAAGAPLPPPSGGGAAEAPPSPSKGTEGEDCDEPPSPRGGTPIKHAPADSWYELSSDDDSSISIDTPPDETPTPDAAPKSTPPDAKPTPDAGPKSSGGKGSTDNPAAACTALSKAAGEQEGMAAAALAACRDEKLIASCLDYPHPNTTPLEPYDLSAAPKVGFNPSTPYDVDFGENDADDDHLVRRGRSLALSLATHPSHPYPVIAGHRRDGGTLQTR